MFANIMRQIKHVLHGGVEALRKHIAARTKLTNTSLARGSVRASFCTSATVTGMRQPGGETIRASKTMTRLKVVPSIWYA
jgi:hypothetical protein